jgi:hypothetical protein
MVSNPIENKGTVACGYILETLFDGIVELKKRKNPSA